MKAVHLLALPLACVIAGIGLLVPNSSSFAAAPRSETVGLYGGTCPTTKCWDCSGPASGCVSGLGVKNALGPHEKVQFSEEEVICYTGPPVIVECSRVMKHVAGCFDEEEPPGFCDNPEN